MSPTCVNGKLSKCLKIDYEVFKDIQYTVERLTTSLDESCGTQPAKHQTDSLAKGFCGVVVITSALHAEGPGFNPQWNQSFILT